MICPRNLKLIGQHWHTSRHKAYVLCHLSLTLCPTAVMMGSFSADHINGYNNKWNNKHNSNISLQHLSRAVSFNKHNTPFLRQVIPTSASLLLRNTQEHNGDIRCHCRNNKNLSPESDRGTPFRIWVSFIGHLIQYTPESDLMVPIAQFQKSTTPHIGLTLIKTATFSNQHFPLGMELAGWDLSKIY